MRVEQASTPWAAPSARGQRAPEVASTALALHEGRLVLEHRQRLLQALDLSIPAPLPLLVGLGLRDAPLLDLGVVLKHSGKLCVLGLTITGHVCDALVRGLELLRLVLHILVLHGPH